MSASNPPKPGLRIIDIDSGLPANGAYTGPQDWKRLSESLKCAGDLILETQLRLTEVLIEKKIPPKEPDRSRISPQVGIVGYMLYAFSLENILKGIRIAQDPENAKRLKDLYRGGKGHDLVALSKDVGLTLKDVERKLLDGLSQLAVWTGRYPASLDSRKKDWNFNPAGVEEFFERVYRLFDSVSGPKAKAEPKPEAKA